MARDGIGTGFAKIDHINMITYIPRSRLFFWCDNDRVVCLVGVYTSFCRFTATEVHSCCCGGLLSPLF